MNDIKLVFSTKPILVIFSLSAAVRVTFSFLILPSSPSILGPDEGTYASLAKHVSQGISVQEFPLYPPTLYNSARSLILPSAFLVKLGVGELNAVRLISSFYGLASCLILVLCFVTYQRLRQIGTQEISIRFDKKFLGLLCMYAFIPSNFIWSTIGLRESSSQFWLMSTFYFSLKLISSSGYKSYSFAALIAIALTLGYGSRPETALIFSIVALAFSLVALQKCRKYLPLAAFTIALIAGQAFTTTPEVEAEESLGAFKVLEAKFIQSPTPKSVDSNQSPTPKSVDSNQSPTPKPVENLEAKENESATPLCEEQNQIVQFEGNEFRCIEKKKYKEVKRDSINTLKEQLSQVQNFEERRNINARDAQSALPVSTCQSSSTEILTLVQCNLSELPFRLFSFLFRPLIFFDQGSMSLNLAAVENVGWMVFIPLALWAALRRTQFGFERIINLSLFSFVLIFSSAAALYEGNLGTAFRHKSTIFWPLVFIVMVAPRLIPRARREFLKTKSSRIP